MSLKNTIKNRIPFPKFIVYCLLITVNCSLLTACTSSSEAFIEKAKEQMLKGKAQEALPFLNKAIDKDPSNPKAFT